MKHLNQFVKFELEVFLKDKTCVVTTVLPWEDYDTHKLLGTKVEVVFLEDNTKYNRKGGDCSTNQYEKLTIKVKKNLSVPVGARIEPVNAVGTVYGTYRNQLAVVAEDIRVITPQKSLDTPRVRL